MVTKKADHAKVNIEIDQNEEKMEVDIINYGNDDLDAVVVGAGFSGLYQLYCLREKLKLRVKVLEAGGGVGLSLIHI